MPSLPVIDRPTAEFIDSGTRVETFRLADFHELEVNNTALAAKPEVLENYTVARRGPTLDAGFAHRLATALGNGVAPKSGLVPSCFDPGVGFRVWHGKDYATVVICFHCVGVKVDGQWNGEVKPVTFSPLGSSRNELLKLSREAFPNDKTLNALPSTS